MEPWLGKLNEGNAEAAWSLFAERYRPLMLASIRHLIDDDDDRLDVYSVVCQALAADDCGRLRKYSGRSGASVSAFVVVLVRNIVVDWIRREKGRKRRTVPAVLSLLQREIYTAICLDGYSHTETYELIRARTASAMPFHTFLQEVRATHRLAPCSGTQKARRPSRESLPADLAAILPDPIEEAETVRRMSEALALHPPDLRLAVELFVIERVPAVRVAAVVGWPNAKAVYNRIYRVLAAIRADLERDGIGPGDL